MPIRSFNLCVFPFRSDLKLWKYRDEAITTSWSLHLISDFVIKKRIYSTLCCCCWWGYCCRCCLSPNRNNPREMYIHSNQKCYKWNITFHHQFYERCVALSYFHSSLNNIFVFFLYFALCGVCLVNKSKLSIKILFKFKCEIVFVVERIKKCATHFSAMALDWTVSFGTFCCALDKLI